VKRCSRNIRKADVAIRIRTILQAAKNMRAPSRRSANKNNHSFCNIRSRLPITLKDAKNFVSMIPSEPEPGSVLKNMLASVLPGKDRCEVPIRNVRAQAMLEQTPKCRFFPSCCCRIDF
jgi:hypothetical protein